MLHCTRSGDSDRNNLENHMILDHAMRALTDTMFVSLFFSLPLMLCVTLGFSAETSPMFKRVMTQRKRFAFAGFGQLGVIAVLLWVLSVANWSPYTLWQGIETSWEHSAPGKVMAFAFVVTLLSPFMTIWALCETVTNPSMMYRKSFRREVYFTAEGEAMEPVTEVMGRNGLEYINTRGEVVEVSRPATFAYGKFIHPVRLFVPYVEAA